MGPSWCRRGRMGDECCDVGGDWEDEVVVCFGKMEHESERVRMNET